MHILETSVPFSIHTKLPRVRFALATQYTDWELLENTSQLVQVSSRSRSTGFCPRLGAKRGGEDFWQRLFSPPRLCDWVGLVVS